MNKGEILYQSTKGYNIRRGAIYYAIFREGTGVNESYSLEEQIAGEETIDEEPIERWLREDLAEDQVDKLNEEAEVRKADLKKKKEEEEKKKKGTLIEQLEKVDSQEAFDKWVKDFELNIIVEPTKIHVLPKGGSSLSPILIMNALIAGTPYCCGGREHGSHSNTINVNTGYFSDNNKREKLLNILVKYLASYYDKMLPSSSLVGYFTISFIKQPNSNLYGNGSAMWGKLYSHSKYWTKVGNFKNKNTNNNLDTYVVSEELTKLYK